MSSGDKSVYLGFWTNWSQGATAGLTYTTTLDNGAFFIAFLALFVTFTGTCFWSIVSFIIHQTLSRQAPQNAIYHQQQAILRTSDTSSAALWRLITLGWAWRKVACATSLKSTFIPLVASLATFSAFTIAGIFSSRVASSRDGEVLIDGVNCATVNLTLMASATDNTAEYYGAGRLRSSFNYKSACYAKLGSMDSCRTFARSTLPYTVTHGTPCPFPGEDRICLSKNGSIRLDSGFLNSHYDLGINAPPSSRYLYRTVAECSPLRDEEYMRYNETNSPKTLQFLYGNSPVECGHRDGCTVEVSDNKRSGNLLGLTQYTVSYVLLSYQIGFKTKTHSRAISRWQLGQNSDVLNLNAWNPIPELSVQDADVNSICKYSVPRKYRYLTNDRPDLESNDVTYATPVRDPWFNATKGPVLIDTFAGNMTQYQTNQPAKALGCTQRYQFCNPALPKNISCTPPLGIFEASQTALATLFPDPQSRDSFEWSSRAIQNMANGFHEVVTILGGGSLLATDTLSAVGQAGLPDNQWELELENWFQFTLADLQRAVLDQATGPVDRKAASFHSAPKTAGGRTVCNNQKIRSDSYTSFNVLGLIIIFAVGGLIMLISVYLPLVTARIQRNRNPYASLEWISNDTLQLQRLAHEAVGAGEWTNACDDYPMARKQDLLAVLDITKQKHPVLRAESEIVERIRIEATDKKQRSMTVETSASTLV